jgi:hypothetical protein
VRQDRGGLHPCHDGIAGGTVTSLPEPASYHDFKVALLENENPIGPEAPTSL